MADLFLGSPGDLADEDEGAAYQYVEISVLRRWQEEMHSAFEIGFKAAGGAIAPDVIGGGPWKFIEISMDRDEIDVIGALVERQRDRAGGPAEHAACVRFLDKIQIFRRKKP
jgi:hypothetical protein